ncbi:hypothetical protein QF026_004179 [Streptomyces aurantiacus]|nr:hypothetical protein [Streptomyces aurantiacus]
MRPDVPLRSEPTVLRGCLRFLRFTARTGARRPPESLLNLCHSIPLTL